MITNLVAFWQGFSVGVIVAAGTFGFICLVAGLIDRYQKPRL